MDRKNQGPSRTNNHLHYSVFTSHPRRNLSDHANAFLPTNTKISCFQKAFRSTISSHMPFNNSSRCFSFSMPSIPPAASRMRLIPSSPAIATSLKSARVDGSRSVVRRSSMQSVRPQERNVERRRDGALYSKILLAESKYNGVLEH